MQPKLIIPKTNLLFSKVVYQASKFETKKEIKHADYIYGKIILNKGIRTYKIDYTSIEFPIVIRYYFLRNNDSSFFINGAIVFSTPINLSIKIESNNLNTSTSSNYSFGVGYILTSKYSLEHNYQTPRDLIKNTGFFDSKYNSLSFMYGFTIL